jgi:hypothetical protein
MILLQLESASSLGLGRGSAPEHPPDSLYAADPLCDLKACVERLEAYCG